MNTRGDIFPEIFFTQGGQCQTYVTKFWQGGQERAVGILFWKQSSPKEEKQVKKEWCLKHLTAVHKTVEVTKVTLGTER